jgi:hypothetical protein
MSGGSCIGNTNLQAGGNSSASSAFINKPLKSELGQYTLFACTCAAGSGSAGGAGPFAALAEAFGGMLPGCHCWCHKMEYGQPVLKHRFLYPHVYVFGIMSQSSVKRQGGQLEHRK